MCLGCFLFLKLIFEEGVAVVFLLLLGVGFFVLFLAALLQYAFMHLIDLGSDITFV